MRALDSAGSETFEVEAEDELPFVQLGHWIALSGVSAGALALYWMLALHLNQGRGDRYVWPTQSILAHMLGYSRGDKIKRFADELVAIGALVVIPVPDVDGPQKRNVYRLRRTPPSGYAGHTSLSSYYAALNEKYEEETAGQSVFPETGGDVHPETGGHVPPQTGVVTTRSSNKKKRDAPSARSAVPDAGGKTSGSRGRATGGAAAPRTSQPRLTIEQKQVVQAVRDALPRDLDRALPVRTPRNVADGILAALAAGQPAERTVGQLVQFRAMPRWDGYWAARFYAGQVDKPIGVLLAMVKPQQECGRVECEERVDIFTGEPCEACVMRAADRRADREQERQPLAAAAVPGPRAVVNDTAGVMRECPGQDGMCCRPLKPADGDLCGRCRSHSVPSPTLIETARM